MNRPLHPPPLPSRHLIYERRFSGFSHLEPLAVMAIAAILTALAMPAIRRVSAVSISAGVQSTTDLLLQARSEAIVRQVPCRFAIVTRWDGNPRANYRGMSLWRPNPSDPASWEQITTWNYLPEGSVFDPVQPSEPAASLNRSTSHFLFTDSLDNTFTELVQGEAVEMRYLEFLPSGSARTNGLPEGTNLWIRIAEGSGHEGTVNVLEDLANFAEIVTDGLIGKVKVHRP